MLVDGLQDGGRVNNTQLIALFLLHGGKKRNEILSQTAKDQPSCALWCWIAAPGVRTTLRVSKKTFTFTHFCPKSSIKSIKKV